MGQGGGNAIVGAQGEARSDGEGGGDDGTICQWGGLVRPASSFFSVRLGDGRAQLVVRLDAVLRAVNIALQLKVAQVAKRVDATGQFVIVQIVM